MRITARSRRAALGAAIVVALTSSCVATFTDQAIAPGGKRIVVGSQQTLIGPQARIWVENNGKIEEVRVEEKAR